MKIIDEVGNQYFDIDNQYSINEFRAHSRGFFRKEDYWKRKRELNTHAYFLFLFTRLEDFISNETTKLINKKRSNITHWKTRAIWDNTDNDIHFRKKLGLLTEKGNADYNKIVDYYNKRNTIAHGGTISGITTAINMIDVFRDMKSYFHKLKA